jgi:hypothetical protein
MIQCVFTKMMIVRSSPQLLAAKFEEGQAND